MKQAAQKAKSRDAETPHGAIIKSRIKSSSPQSSRFLAWIRPKLGSCSPTMSINPDFTTRSPSKWEMRWSCPTTSNIDLSTSTSTAPTAVSICFVKRCRSAPAGSISVSLKSSTKRKIPTSIYPPCRSGRSRQASLSQIPFLPRIPMPTA